MLASVGPAEASVDLWRRSRPQQLLFSGGNRSEGPKITRVPGFLFPENSFSVSDCRKNALTDLKPKKCFLLFPSKILFEFGDVSVRRQRGLLRSRKPKEDADILAKY